MSEKTSLSLSMTSALGDKLTKAVADVNPAADNSALNAFAQGLAGLTTNTLVSTSKITKQDISDSYYPIQLVRVTDTAGNATFTKVDDTHYTIPVSYFFDSDDSEYVRQATTDFKVKANNIDITQHVMNDIWAKSEVFDDDSKYIIRPAVFADSRDANNLKVDLVLYGDSPSDAAQSDYQNRKFYLWFPGGDFWEETIITFTIV